MDVKTIKSKLLELADVRAALLGELSKVDGIKAVEEAQPMIVQGSKEHETLLSTGYGMTADEARAIIKERDEDPVRWPLAEMRKAKAMLTALAAKNLKPTSTRRPWRVGRAGRA